MDRKVFIVGIGSEYVEGIKASRHISYISKKVVERGLNPIGVGISPDDFYYFQYFIKMALDKADIVFIVGLGGERDNDIREAVSEAIGVPLIYNKNWLDYIKSNVNDYTEEVRKFARIPYGAKEIENPIGLALGFIKVLNDVNKAIVVLPESISELAPMLERVFEYLGLNKGDKYLEVLRLFGIEYDKLIEKLEGIDDYRLIQSPKGIDIYLKDRFPENLKAKVNVLKERLGKVIYAIGEVEMEEVVGKLLRERGFSISTAESSTGGLISARIVNVAGCSSYMLGGVVAYSNDIKKKVLGVKRETLEKFGAVSKETAEEMVRGVAKLFNSDIAVSDTGIAGPTGATPKKPLGLHYVGLYFKGEVLVDKIIYKGERNETRLYVSQYGLNLVRLKLLD